MNYKVTKTNEFANSDIFNTETGCNLFTVDGEFYVEGADSQAQADSLMAVHNPVDIKAQAATAKAALLAKLGITAEEAQLLIGGN